VEIGRHKWKVGASDSMTRVTKDEICSLWLRGLKPAFSRVGNQKINELLLVVGDESALCRISFNPSAVPSLMT